MSYLIAYFATGLLLAIGLAINGIVSKDKRIVALLAVIALWPLIILVAPGSFFRNATTRDRRLNEADPLSSKLTRILTQVGDVLDNALVVRLSKTADSGESTVTYFGIPGSLDAVLDAYWNSNIPPSIFNELRRAQEDLEDHDDVQAPTGLFSRAPPDWYIGLSNEFLKCIAKADGKLRGRILDALGKISTSPVSVVGDTLKPLTGDLAGLWRYRIGDDRLVYLPDNTSRRITLLYFGPRGSVYREVVNPLA